MLEALGYEKKNDRYFLEMFIRDNPTMTAQQIGYKTESSCWLVYTTAKRIGHRFETKYTLKSSALRNHQTAGNYNST